MVVEVAWVGPISGPQEMYTSTSDGEVAYVVLMSPDGMLRHWGDRVRLSGPVLRPLVVHAGIGYGRQGHSDLHITSRIIQWEWQKLH